MSYIYFGFTFSGVLASLLSFICHYVVLSWEEEEEDVVQ
jgi:hypothetical protein